MDVVLHGLVSTMLVAYSIADLKLQVPFCIENHEFCFRTHRGALLAPHIHVDDRSEFASKT